MNFFKIIFISLYLITISNLSLADNHSKEQDIIEKAKANGVNLCLPLDSIDPGFYLIGFSLSMI